MNPCGFRFPRRSLLEETRDDSARTRSPSSPVVGAASAAGSRWRWRRRERTWRSRRSIASPAPHSTTADATVSGVAAARQVADEVRALGRRATVIGADVTQWAQVTAMVDAVVRELGGLDVLVCNAGVVHISPVERLTEEAFDLTMAVNVKGVFLACKAAIPVLKGRPGASIINVASVAGRTAPPAWRTTARRSSPSSASPTPSPRSSRASACAPMRSALASCARRCGSTSPTSSARRTRTARSPGSVTSRPSSRSAGRRPGGHRPARRLPGLGAQRHRPGHQRRRRHGAPLRPVAVSPRESTGTIRGPNPVVAIDRGLCSILRSMKQPSPPPIRVEKSRWRQNVESIGLALVIAFAVRSSVVQAFWVPSGSMLPTIQIGDHIFVNKLAYSVSPAADRHPGVEGGRSEAQRHRRLRLAGRSLAPI